MVEDVNDGEEKFFGLIADHHPTYDVIRDWMVVADTGVAWRATPDFHNRMAGKGPPKLAPISSPSLRAHT